VTIYEFEGRVPSIAPNAYVDDDAKVLGDRTSIQENCVLHARINETCAVGSHVQIGHGALLHNCSVKDYAVVGVGAVVSDYATVGVWSIIGKAPSWLATS
jgi:carbonic anhydrase/acetyltransferase-like protein (isoleucine patch superfamily)